MNKIPRIKLIASTIVFLISCFIVEPIIAIICQINFFNSNDFFYASGQATFFYIFACNFIIGFIITSFMFYGRPNLQLIWFIPVSFLVTIFMLYTWIVSTTYGHDLVKTDLFTDTFGDYFLYYIFTLVQALPLCFSGKQRRKMLRTFVICFTIAILVYGICNYLTYIGIKILFDFEHTFGTPRYLLSLMRIRYYIDLYLLVYGCYKLELLKRAELKSVDISDTDDYIAYTPS